jgi:hypothetical protein
MNQLDEFVIKILEKELYSYSRCLEKSIESFGKNEIDYKTHLTHTENLNPKIDKLKEAIKILKNSL